MFYFVFGVRRSGNHAIIGWLYGLLMDEYIHMNDLTDFDLNNFIRASKINPVYKIKDNEIIPYRGAKNVIISIEDKDSSVVDHIINYLISQGKQYKKITILRDPLNQYASWIQTYNEISDLRVKCYINIMNEMLTKPENNNNIYIHYTKWNDNLIYRNNLAKKMGLINKDRYFNQCFGCATSLFENKDTVNHKLYNNRWKRFQDHPEILNINKQIISIWKNIQTKFEIKMSQEYDNFINKIYI
jgi:hypothetical protein